MFNRLTYTFVPLSVAIRDPDPVALTLKLAHAKADAIISQGKIPNDGKPSLLICADQVIVCNGTIREKPENEEQARFYLRSYKDYPAEAVDAVVVVNTATGQRWEGVATGKIFWKEIPESKIDELIAKGDIFSCAGGFVVEQLRDYIMFVSFSLGYMISKMFIHSFLSPETLKATSQS